MAEGKSQFSMGAFAMIFDEAGRILLCHRTDIDIWNLPGGRMEYGEAPWETVVREVKEEVGLTVGVEKLIGVYSKKNENDIVYQFLCRVISGTALSADHESDQVGYFHLDEFPLNTNQKQKQRIQLYLENPTVIQMVDQTNVINSKDYLTQLGNY